MVSVTRVRPLNGAIWGEQDSSVCRSHKGRLVLSYIWLDVHWNPKIAMTPVCGYRWGRCLSLWQHTVLSVATKLASGFRWHYAESYHYWYIRLLLTRIGHRYICMHWLYTKKTFIAKLLFMYSHRPPSSDSMSFINIYHFIQISDYISTSESNKNDWRYPRSLFMTNYVAGYHVNC